MPNLTTTEINDDGEYSAVVAVRNLKDGDKNAFEVSPPPATRARLATEYGLIELKKLRLKGGFAAQDKEDWRLEATLGATVVQACVITGEPVSTRLDVPVSRVFVQGFSEQDPDSEIEFDGDDEREPLESSIDLALVMTEALALNLPDYPRSEGAVLEESAFSAPGTTPMRDQDTKPFAALAKLRDKLEQ